MFFIQVWVEELFTDIPADMVYRIIVTNGFTIVCMQKVICM